ncbi:MAG: nuclear transport factor 2 family protein [Bacteroidota bacterium]|nr:nuclear transport factor 2 family protein [Bacteroidota bacterium]
MKNLILISLIVVFFSCVSPEDQQKIDGANRFYAGIEEFNKNVKILDQDYNNFENGDLQKMFDNTSEDLIWNSPSGDSLSKEAWMEGLKGWHDQFENFKFVGRDYYPSVDDSLFLPDGGVRAYGKWNFTHKETGTEFSQTYYAVSKFNSEGKQVELYEMYDLGGIFMKLNSSN